MANTSTTATGPMASSPASQFLAVYQREHGTTKKVLAAFPSDRSDFRPHERSNAAHGLAWTFVAEERMMLMAIRDQPVLGGGLGKPPESWGGVLEIFERQHHEIVQELQGLGDEPLTNVVSFFVGPRQPGNFAAMDFLWFMLFDQIHHRGQLSVYVRMAGGKVPSIYGPTADEPWT